jgi:hypothetical protein
MPGGSSREINIALAQIRSDMRRMRMCSMIEPVPV